MNIKSQFRKLVEEVTLVGVAVLALAILKYESIIRKRNEHR
jgi:hypothetical protein